MLWLVSCKEMTFTTPEVQHQGSFQLGKRMLAEMENGRDLLDKVSNSRILLSKPAHLCIINHQRRH